MHTNPVDVPTFASAYAASYGNTILACERVGTGGASLISFRRPAGRYVADATSDFALTMVHNGGFDAEFDLGSGRFGVSLSPGELFLAPPFTATEHDLSRDAKGIVVAVGHQRVAELLHETPLGPNTFRALYTRPVRDDFIRVALNQLLICARSRLAADTFFADGVILAIFAALAKHGARRAARARRGLADWQLRRVVEKIESLQAVSLAELAASANLSPFYFARAFKQTTGVPPHHFQQRVRIERAKDLLTSTSLSITEIAFRVGYGSSQTLARVFRRNVGSTPAEYRRCAGV
jgi:AraC family transcriptional regulator